MYTEKDLYDGMLLLWAKAAKNRRFEELDPYLYIWNKQESAAYSYFSKHKYESYTEKEILSNLNAGHCIIYQRNLEPLIFN